MFVAHRLAPTHPRSKSLQAELARATRHPKRRSPAVFIFVAEHSQCQDNPPPMPPPRSIPQRRLQGPWGPWPPRAGPPTSSPMTVSLSQIRPRGTRFLTTTSRGETFASRRYFAPGGMAIRPRTGRWPGSDARAVRGRRRRERWQRWDASPSCLVGSNRDRDGIIRGAGTPIVGISPIAVIPR